MDEEDTPSPATADVTKGIWLNGVGDDGHEPLVLNQLIGDKFNFIKTAQKDYDIVVACILLRAHSLAPKEFELR